MHPGSGATHLVEYVLRVWVLSGLGSRQVSVDRPVEEAAFLPLRELLGEGQGRGRHAGAVYEIVVDPRQRVAAIVQGLGKDL